MKYLVPLLGRILFGAIFVVSLPGHFSSEMIQMAADRNVPAPSVMVPLAGIIAFIGGVSVILGLKARVGAWLLVLFLVPVTLTMHNFWTVLDPSMAKMQELMFLKNLPMIGGALFIAYFGAGPLSVDAWLESTVTTVPVPDSTAKPATAHT